MNKTQQQGFTLIELMIVVLTLAILATIAYPSYETYVRNTRLENVRADLLLSAQSLERFYAQQHKFPDNKSQAASDAIENNEYFNIRYEEDTQNKKKLDNFFLTAEPNTKNPNEDRYMQLDGNGIITVCKGRTAPPANSTAASSKNCYVYK